VLKDIMLFFHVSTVAVWLGSIVAVLFMLQMIRKQAKSPEISTLIPKMLRTFNRITHPSAFVVLISGIIMILEMGLVGQSKPFWLSYMEQGGGMVVLLSIILLTWQGRRIMKGYTSVASGQGQAVAGFQSYITYMVGSIVLILSVVFVVAFKI